MQTITLIVLSIAILVIVQKTLAFWRVLCTVQLPGWRTLFNLNCVTFFFPPVPLLWVSNTAFAEKHTTFEQYDSDIFTAVSVLPAAVEFIVADPHAIKEIVKSRVRFPKPVHLYTLLLAFGNNLVASEHDEWKKYRRIAGPSFTEPNSRLVWQETVHVMNDLFSNVWTDKKEIVSDHALEITKPIALLVIGAAGFGRHMPWNNELKAPSARESLLFQNALLTVAEEAVKLMIPRYVGVLVPCVRKAHEAFDELKRCMLEMIEGRKNANVKEERFDLLNSLLDANMTAGRNGLGDDAKLTEDEVLGNIFIFLLAGHETSAHVLCFALGLLALHPEEQERVHQEILTAVPENRDPAFQDLRSLPYVQCVLNETLRMFPPVNIVPKQAAESCVLTTTNNSGEIITVAIPKGSYITLRIISLHYNPKYWEDPLSFKPARFNGDWPRDAFLPFGGGARSCLGRRFAELEFIVAIVMLVRRYRIIVKDEPQFAGETFEQRKERVLRAKNGLTLTPVKMPLTFVLRD